jgi:hypothetical protein
MRTDDGAGGRGRGGPPTTRRRLISQTLGLVPIVRDHLDRSEREDDGRAAEPGYRTYREGVADLRRRERAAGKSPPPPPAQIPHRQVPRTWREGAEEVAERERRE